MAAHARGGRDGAAAGHGRGIGLVGGGRCRDGRGLPHPVVDVMKRRIALISTGGTIEKTYDELSGVLANHVSVLDVMLVSLELRGIEVQRVQLMNKDSLDMTPEDHTLIAEVVQDAVNELKITTGSTVYAAVKASAFRMLPG